MCRVLGPTEADVDGSAIDLGGPVPRRLFTALIAADGRSVSDDRLVDATWGSDAPLRTSAALQVYVSRLRLSLRGDRQQLERRGSGYALRLAPETTDVTRFTRRIEEGRQLLAAGSAVQAAHGFGEALSLWRGEPFADLSSSGLSSGQAVAARTRLLELREVALEEQAAARLAMGDAAGAVSGLRAAVTASPYRERRWALLALGLYRCGRQVDALATMRRVRKLLADELGVEPGIELRELERRVLAQDPHLLLATPARATAPAGSGGNHSWAGRRGAGRGHTRPLSTFVGRDHDLAVLAVALDRHRLVTVVGPAGVGKTRLAVEHLANRTESGGSWLVRLADVSPGDALTRGVAEALHAEELSGDAPADLVRALAGRAGLVVLDNCEHLTDAVAELALALLNGCPGLRILVTSREPLGVDGEGLVPIHQLPLLAGDGSPGPAVDLLMDRVRAVRPGWTPNAEDLALVPRICAALDGLPLALELAAARARVLGLKEIAENLGDRFRLLGAVPRGSTTSHSTLHDAIGWSVEALASAERALLFRLWPFEGGFSLDAADAVRPTGTPTIDSLSTLVSRSVVIADTTTTPARYRILETLRAYCGERDPDPAGSREKHARWVRDLVARCANKSPEQPGILTAGTLARELPNLCAGILHDLKHQPEVAMRTVGMLRLVNPRLTHQGITRSRRAQPPGGAPPPESPTTL